MDDKRTLIEEYYTLEGMLLKNKGDKPVAIKSAICWGALALMEQAGEILPDEKMILYAHFMSKITGVK